MTSFGVLRVNSPKTSFVFSASLTTSCRVECAWIFPSARAIWALISSNTVPWDHSGRITTPSPVSSAQRTPSRRSSSFSIPPWTPCRFGQRLHSKKRLLFERRMGWSHLLSECFGVVSLREFVPVSELFHEVVRVAFYVVHLQVFSRKRGRFRSIVQQPYLSHRSFSSVILLNNRVAHCVDCIGMACTHTLHAIHDHIPQFGSGVLEHILVGRKHFAHCNERQARAHLEICYFVRVGSNVLGSSRALGRSEHLFRLKQFHETTVVVELFKSEARD